MFTPIGLKVLALVAMLLSLLGLAISVFGSLEAIGYRFAFFMGIFSWVFLLGASYIGFRLSSYKLYKEEYTKVGIRLLLIIAAFMLFFFVGTIIGLLVSVVLFAALWGLKRNYDEWGQKNVQEETMTEETDAS